MEQPLVIKFPAEPFIRQSQPQTEITEIKEMFREMNQRYMVYQPPLYYFTLKRILDFTISALFIATVLIWLFPILALLIKLTSKGPVLFVQKRTGLLGKEFNCFKFRTMYTNKDADTKQAVLGDKRITTIGKFLRMMHFDEMPQLFNVLLGDMSLVGPRPHMLYHTRFYAQYIPYYNLRHEAAPGMTGMAQIKGYVGEINLERDLRKRIQWDIYYLKNRSIKLDIMILLSTAGQVFLKLFHVYRRKGQ